MLNTQKLLYILPELAYVAELLPDKKPHTFSIQSFKQINGQLLDESDNFIVPNINKLFSKLDSGEEYHLILPDFLFANTIITLNETSEAKIKEELKTSVLPSLGISDESHYLETFVLNELRGTSRVQIAAIEKELLLAIKVAASESGVVITGTSPLSWAIKSIVSLEPSITVVQLGSYLFTSEHYIGVDQSTVAPVSDIDNTIETIKTLKGAEASIQTVYVLSNALVEKTLKDELSKTLPIQQMADLSDDDDRMPSYVKTAIEFSMRTLSISDYPVPVFHFGKVTAEEKAQFNAALESDKAPETDDTDTDLDELPKPATAPVLPVETPKLELPEPEIKPEPVVTEESLEEVAVVPTLPVVIPTVTAQALPITSIVTTPAPVEAALPSPDPQPEATTPRQPVAVAKAAVQAPAPVIQPSTPIKPIVAPPEPPEEDDIDLSQFTQAQSPVGERTTPVVKAAPPLIKNKSGVGHMMKMILITVGVLLATVALGVGIALAYIKFATPTDTSETPAVEVTATPTPAPTATPEPTPPPASESAALTEDLTVLIVNATTKAGYAGTIKSKIDAGKFGTVTAGNAKGTYSTKGNFMYLKEDNAAVQPALEKATGLKFTKSADAKAEDAAGKYDLVVVLAE